MCAKDKSQRPRFRTQYSSDTGTVHVLTPDGEHIMGEVSYTLRADQFLSYRYPEPCIGPIMPNKKTVWYTHPTLLEAAKCVAGLIEPVPTKLWGEE